MLAAFQAAGKQLEALLRFIIPLLRIGFQMAKKKPL